MKELIIAAIVIIAFGIVGEMDYQDACFAAKHNKVQCQ